MGCNNSKVIIPSIPVLGLCDSGKTSIIYYISKGKFKNAHQTLSVQTTKVSHNDKKINLLDVPGRDCSYWSRYYSRSSAFIFVVDGANPKETELFIEYAKLALNNINVQKLPILFYINKVNDEEGEKVKETLSSKLDLEHKNLTFQFSICDPKTGKGILEGYNWIIGTQAVSDSTKTPLL